MGFLNKRANLFRSPRPASRYFPLEGRCKRCGEAIQGQVDLYNDLSMEWDEGGSNPRYICRKVLMGEGTCFQQIEVLLTFDTERKLKERQISGGTFQDEEI